MPVNVFKKYISSSVDQSQSDTYHSMTSLIQDENSQRPQTGTLPRKFRRNQTEKNSPKSVQIRRRWPHGIDGASRNNNIANNINHFNSSYDTENETGSSTPDQKKKVLRRESGIKSLKSSPKSGSRKTVGMPILQHSISLVSLSKLTFKLFLFVKKLRWKSLDHLVLVILFT